MKAELSKLSVRLLFKGIKLFTVESCTGGGIGKEITSLSGSSAWYEGGLITYSNLSKNRLAAVPLELIDKYGAVSVEVADSMAKGGQIHFPDSISVAVTGIAGPTGGTATKPVGTVCIACCHGKKVKTREYRFDGNREQVQRQTILEALQMVLSMTG
jgi:nicotinamide-nucleotide amidase